MPGLDNSQIRDFIESGYVRIDQAFPTALAEAARDILWRDMGLSPDDPAGWTEPLVRLGMYGGAPFVEAANTAVLTRAYDRLVGPGRWRAPAAMGTFPIRFPSSGSSGDEGWHVDVSFDSDKPDYMDWRVNWVSRGRALLMLFLFSDVGEDDAPTRIRKRSHRDVARMLAPAGAAGLTMRELAPRFVETAGREEVLATGAAGTVYLCHPFLVHSAQAHRGAHPRFMAQPPLFPRSELQLKRADRAYSPVETAVKEALGQA